MRWSTSSSAQRRNKQRQIERSAGAYLPVNITVSRSPQQMRVNGKELFQNQARSATSCARPFHSPPCPDQYFSAECSVAPA
jgi:hypothetical protein